MSAKPTPVNPQAYDAYLKGLSAEGRSGFDGLKAAVAYYESAVGAQPDFAEGHAAIGRAQSQLLFAGPLSPREIVPKAEAAARRALQLDDTLADAHRTLGSILSNYYWQWDAADEEFQRAGQHRQDLAQHLAQVLQARQLDPLSFNVCMDVGVAYRRAGEYNRALEEFRHALEIAPDQPRGYFQIGVTLVMLARAKDAVATSKRRSHPLEVVTRGSKHIWDMRTRLQGDPASDDVQSPGVPINTAI